MKKYFVLCILLASFHINAAMISLVPSTSHLNVGDSFILNVFISQLAPNGSPSLAGFDLNIHFENSLLLIDSTDLDTDGVFDSIVIDPDSELDITGLDLNFFSTEMLSASVLRIFEGSLDLPSDLDTFQSSSFKLAEIHMSALQSGISDIFITINGLVDANGNALEFTTESTQIIVNGIPVPAPTLGLVFAIIAASLLRRHKRRSHLFML